MAERDSDEDRRQFAVERSHKDADKSNETIRATAQAAILINGGAATAILAFLSKEGIDPTVYQAAPVSLLGYALGVAAGFFAMYCSVRSLDEYQMRWRLEAYPEPGRSADTHRDKAYVWWRRMRDCFFVSMLGFVLGSGSIALAICNSVPPKKVGAADPAAHVTNTRPSDPPHS